MVVCGLPGSGKTTYARRPLGTRLLPLGPLRGLLEHVQRSLAAARKRPCLLAAAAGRTLRAIR